MRLKSPRGLAMLHCLQVLSCPAGDAHSEGGAEVPLDELLDGALMWGAAAWLDLGACWCLCSEWRPCCRCLSV